MHHVGQCGRLLKSIKKASLKFCQSFYLVCEKQKEKETTLYRNEKHQKFNKTLLQDFPS